MPPHRRRKVYSSSYGTRPILMCPMIRLTGKYLEILGFRIGDNIEVLYEPGKITITKVTELPFPRFHRSNPGGTGTDVVVAAISRQEAVDGGV